MILSRQQVIGCIVALIAIGCSVVAIVWPSDAPASLDHLAIGVILGTLFGQTTASAAWNAFGPGEFIWRLPLSLLWLGSLPVAFAINVAWHPSQGPGAPFAVMMAGCLLAQWTLGQLPLWGLVWKLGLQLRHADDSQGNSGREWRQFGIRQLMVVTVVIGVLLGIGRNLAVYWSPDGAGGEWLIFAFLSVAAVLMTVPLVLATLLPRHALNATLVILVLVGVATAFEWPLLKIVGGGGPEMEDFIYINFVGSAWIVAFALSVRLGGYSLAMPAKG
jgi:hypothetical protein